MQHPAEEAEDETWIYNGKDEVPPTVRRVKIAETVIEIPEEAFTRHEELEEVILSSSVQVIGKHAFSFCIKLKSILYYQGLLDEKKEEVGIPSNVKVIEYGAFAQCKLLKSLVLNEGLERIRQFAFNGCDSLSHVRIPQSVNTLATNAFVHCINLISIEFPEECSFFIDTGFDNDDRRQGIIDLSGCQSLVNLAGPMPTFRRDLSRRQFFQNSKLGILVVGNEADLIHRLKHRFDNSPLNKLCYYQSYQSFLVDAGTRTMAQLHSRMEDENPLAATTTQVDEFGMTPLHVLSLSQTPNLDMLLAVMDAGKRGHMVRIRDSFGCTPMDYLCLNRMPNSNQAIDEALAGDWSSRKSEIGGVVRKFERKEILSLLELRLWKVKIDGATSKKVKIGEATSKKEQILADRQWCRVMSGAAAVIPHVLPFLDN
eukprot:scaffold3955_cov160-Cylindrotheca_fusiformis.AAC.11